MDYQRQLHEHLNAQAQLLRQMSMGMDIIPSESGSDRSSSAASECCSPDVSGRLSDQHSLGASGRASTPPHGSGSQSAGPVGACGSSASGGGGSAAASGGKQKKAPNGTPLDALFQMTNKSFEEAQGESGAGIHQSNMIND